MRLGLYSAALAGVAALFISTMTQADGRARPAAPEKPAAKAVKSAGRCNGCGCKTGSRYRLIKSHKCVGFDELLTRCRKPNRCIYEGTPTDNLPMCPADPEERARVIEEAPSLCEGFAE
jgi:hypothetical protein